MELKEFIKKVLVDVCDAIYEAKVEVKESAIAPTSIDGRPVDREQLINFEISVSVQDSVKGNSDGKIQVLSLGASLGKETSQETSHINKISFQVPVYYSARFNKLK